MTAHKGLRTTLSPVAVSVLPNLVYYPYLSAVSLRNEYRTAIKWLTPMALIAYREQVLRYIIEANSRKRQLRKQGGR